MIILYPGVHKSDRRPGQEHQPGLQPALHGSGPGGVRQKTTTGGNGERSVDHDDNDDNYDDIL